MPRSPSGGCPCRPDETTDPRRAPLGDHDRACSWHERRPRDRALDLLAIQDPFRGELARLPPGAVHAPQAGGLLVDEYDRPVRPATPRRRSRRAGRSSGSIRCRASTFATRAGLPRRVTRPPRTRPTGRRARRTGLRPFRCRAPVSPSPIRAREHTGAETLSRRGRETRASAHREKTPARAARRHPGRARGKRDGGADRRRTRDVAAERIHRPAATPPAAHTTSASPSVTSG